MKAEPANVGALLVDSLPFSEGGTAGQAQALADDGVNGVYGYLGVITPERVGFILDAGMAFLPVTLAGHHDGAASVAQLAALGVPTYATVCLDVEGLTDYHDVALVTKIAEWADALATAGFMPGGYFGSPQSLTSDEMWSLPLKRYWRGQGSIRDRHNALAEPTKCGWCVTQMFPSVVRGGVLVDIDVVGQDYLGRVPNWCIAA